MGISVQPSSSPQRGHGYPQQSNLQDRAVKEQNAQQVQILQQEKGNNGQLFSYAQHLPQQHPPYAQGNDMSSIKLQQQHSQTQSTQEYQPVIRQQPMQWQEHQAIQLPQQLQQHQETQQQLQQHQATPQQQQWPLHNQQHHPQQTQHTYHYFTTY